MGRKKEIHIRKMQIDYNYNGENKIIHKNAADQFKCSERALVGSKV